MARALTSDRRQLSFPRPYFFHVTATIGVIGEFSYDRGCVETYFNFHLSRGWARVLRVVDRIEIDRFLRSNLKALSA